MARPRTFAHRFLVTTSGDYLTCADYKSLGGAGSASASQDTTDARASSTRTGGALLVASGVVFTLLNTVAESLYPGYSVGKDALSTLGGVGAPTMLLWDGQLMLSGLMTLLGTYLLFVRGRPAELVKGRLAKAVYFLPPLGTILVSLVPWNTVIAVHSLGAFVTFVFGGIAAVYSSRFTPRPLSYLSLVLGLTTLLSIPFLGSGLYLGFGGVERLVVYPYVIWGIAFGAYWAGATAPGLLS